MAKQSASENLTEMSVKEYCDKYRYEKTPDEIVAQLGIDHNPIDELTFVKVDESGNVKQGEVRKLYAAVDPLPAVEGEEFEATELTEEELNAPADKGK